MQLEQRAGVARQLDRPFAAAARFGTPPQPTQCDRLGNLGSADYAWPTLRTRLHLARQIDRRLRTPGECQRFGARHR